MKQKLTIFLEELTKYDYILFGGVFSLFLLFLILALLLRKKTFLSSLLALISFVILFLGPTLGYVKMHEYIFASSVKLLSQKKLNYSAAIIVKGEVTNLSKHNFKQCRISAAAIKKTGNKYKDYIFQFKPLKKMSIVQKDIKKGETRAFKMFIEPFTYAKDYNVTLKADCR